MLGKKATAVATIVILIIAVLAAVYYSYQQIELSLENVQYAGINFRTPSPSELIPITSNLLIGNVPGAISQFALAVVDSIDLVLTIKVFNGGFLPVTIPPFSYSILVYDEYLGAGQYPQSTTVSPGSYQFIQVKQNVKLAALPAIAEQVVRNNGVLEIRIDGKVRVFFFDIPFSASRSVNVYNEVAGAAKQYFTGLVPERPKAPSLTVTDAWWTTDGLRVEAVPEGETVKIHVMAKAADSFSGTVNMELRKDIALAPDISAGSQSFPLTLSAGEQKELRGSFRAEGGSGVRGYFVKLSWEGGSYEMPNTYPPRLQVRPLTVTILPTPLPSPSPLGKLNVLSVWWTRSGTAIQVDKVLSGELVEAHVMVRASGGSFSGTVWVELRQDIALAPDESVGSQSFSLSLENGEQRELTLIFPAEGGLGVRGYFLKISWDGGWYEMPDSYPPRLKIT